MDVIVEEVVCETNSRHRSDVRDVTRAMSDDSEEFWLWKATANPGIYYCLACDRNGVKSLGRVRRFEAQVNAHPSKEWTSVAAIPDRASAAPARATDVRIVAHDMPFMAIVMHQVTWALASIPALIILTAIGVSVGVAILFLLGAIH